MRTISSYLLLNLSATLSTSHFPFLTVALDFSMPDVLDPDMGIRTWGGGGGGGGGREGGWQT